MTQSFFAGLSADEQNIVRLYKNNSDFDSVLCFADHLNTLLRAGRDLEEPWSGAAKVLSAVATKWRCQEETMLYRATFDDFVTPYISGDSYTYPAFMSTTEDPNGLQRHWANSVPKRTPAMLSIRCPPDSSMAWMDTSSALPEREFLLDRGRSFQILALDEIGKPEMVELMGMYSKNYDRLIKYELQLVD